MRWRSSTSSRARGAKPQHLREIRALVEQIELPSPWDLHALIDSLSRQTGCTFLLHPLDDLPPEISGVSLPAGGESANAYVLCYDARVPAWSQLIIILHEIGHHLLGHSGGADACSESSALLHGRSDEEGHER